MQISSQLTTALTGVMLFGAAVPCVAQTVSEGDKDHQVRVLERKLTKSNHQRDTLAEELAASRQREDKLTKSSNDLRLRFAALGENLLNGGQDKILQAVKNAEVLDKQVIATETAALKLMTSLREYLRTAVIADSDARLDLETSIRELDVALRIRQKPRPQIALGNLSQAKIISIDAESGMAVINAGENQSVRRGMRFDILRGNREVAEVIVAETRENFSGVLPTELDETKEHIRAGDIASIQTEQR